jgi:hypothetical protein
MCAAAPRRRNPKRPRPATLDSVLEHVLTGAGPLVDPTKVGVLQSFVKASGTSASDLAIALVSQCGKGSADRRLRALATIGSFLSLSGRFRELINERVALLEAGFSLGPRMPKEPSAEAAGMMLEWVGGAHGRDLWALKAASQRIFAKLPHVSSAAPRTTVELLPRHGPMLRACELLTTLWPLIQAIESDEAVGGGDEVMGVWRAQGLVDRAKLLTAAVGADVVEEDDWESIDDDESGRQDGDREVRDVALDQLESACLAQACSESDEEEAVSASVVRPPPLPEVVRAQDETAGRALVDAEVRDIGNELRRSLLPSLTNLTERIRRWDVGELKSLEEAVHCLRDSTAPHDDVLLQVIRQPSPSQAVLLEGVREFQRGVSVVDMERRRLLVLQRLDLLVVGASHFVDIASTTTSASSRSS